MTNILNHIDAIKYNMLDVIFILYIYIYIFREFIIYYLILYNIDFP